MKDPGEILTAIGVVIYNIGLFATVVFLTFFDGYEYTWWNWIIAIPVNCFMGIMWPIYWLLLRPLFG